MIVVGTKSINCFLCKHYAPNDFLEFQGKCTRNAPRIESIGSAGGNLQGFPDIKQPINTWCGDFENWTGEARDQGFCPYPNEAPEAAEVTAETAAAADDQAAKAATVATTTKAAATKTTKKGAK